MNENKLGTYLASFTSTDWSSYHKFSKSQYLEKSDYQLIINYIKKHRSRYNTGYIDIENLRKKVKPLASTQAFANVISGLCRSIEKYLIWAEVENDPMMNDTLLLQALGKRGLSLQFHKQKQKSKEKREKSPKGLWNRYHDFMADYLTYYCNMTSKIEAGKMALEESFTYLSQFNDTIKGYLGVEMHNRTTILNEDWSETINDLDLKNSTNNEFKEIYYHLMELKEFKKVASFDFLKKELFKDHLSKELRNTILIHLTSFINNQKVRGKIEDGKGILQLYQYGLENNLLFPNGLIPLIRYINIISVACDVNEYEWASNFVSDYSNLVASKNIEEIKILGFAQIDFSKGDFEKVINLLREIKFKYFDVETRARWLLLSSIYETNRGDYTLIDYYVQSYNNFLKRNKFKTTKLKINGLKNSAYYLSMIAKGKNLATILEKLKTEKTLYYRKWLILKVDEILIKN